MTAVVLTSVRKHAQCSCSKRDAIGELFKKVADFAASQCGHCEAYAQVQRAFNYNLKCLPQVSGALNRLS